MPQTWVLWFRSLKTVINDIIDGNYFLRPKTSADADAPNNSIYYSSTQSALVYKGSDGTIYTLAGATPLDGFALLEDGSFLLLESGDKVLFEGN